MIYPELTADAIAESHTYLESVQSSQARRSFSVSTAVLDGDPASAILDMAEQKMADIIVMSSHGYSGLTRWLLGSVAEKVLRGAACPVLVVRSPQAIRRVLIPLDGSDLSSHVLAPAIAAAQGLGASVTLLRVVPELHEQERYELDQLEPGLGRRLVEELQEDAKSYLRRVAETHQRPGQMIEHEVRTGPAAGAILRYAAQHPIDLIAMATHGRTGLGRWVYGSVTEKVLRAGSYSMLVVRPRVDALN